MTKISIKIVKYCKFSLIFQKLFEKAPWRPTRRPPYIPSLVYLDPHPRKYLCGRYWPFHFLIIENFRFFPGLRSNSILQLFVFLFFHSRSFSKNLFHNFFIILIYVLVFCNPDYLASTTDRIEISIRGFQIK